MNYAILYDILDLQLIIYNCVILLSDITKKCGCSSILTKVYVFAFH
jgi:hypothetical protein